jgi:hypothetical protein
MFVALQLLFAHIARGRRKLVRGTYGREDQQQGDGLRSARHCKEW